MCTHGVLLYFTGPESEHIANGAHADGFSERVGKSHVAGFRVPPGTIWQARGMI